MRLVPLAGPVADLHAREIPAELGEAETWAFTPTDRALVLGSSQQDAVADDAAISAAGLAVVRRRSGGGAVYVDPDRCLWVDVVVPRDDPRWSDDVRAATYWLGETWQAALRRIGIDSQLYAGGLEQTSWGRLVCFAALGPGEVLVDGRKTVGISQRRTRAGARFQCIVYDRWDARDVLDRLAMTDADRLGAGADLADIATGVGDRLEALRRAIVEELVGPGPMH